MKNGVPAKAGPWIVGLLLLISFGVDWHNLAASGSIDLRNRVTGMRLLQAGIDPYHYKWRSGESEAYCDPYNNPAVPVSKTTVTPPFLLLHLPLAGLPYRAGQFLWLLAQWLALAGTAGLWWRALPAVLHKLVFGLFVAGFTWSPAWRLHAERGQSYIVLALLLAAWILLSRKAPAPRRECWAGALAGVLVALRPPLLLVLAPFILLRRPAQRKGALLGLAVAAALPLLYDASCWRDYGSAMQTWSELYRSGVNPRPPRQAFPAMVEGMPIDLLARFADIPFADSSVFFLLRRGFDIAPVAALPVLGVFAALLAAWYVRAWGLSADLLLLGIAAWALVIDSFLPALRNSYNDVLALNVAGCALLVMRKPFRLAWLPLLALFASWWVLAACAVSIGLGWRAPRHLSAAAAPSAL